MLTDAQDELSKYGETNVVIALVGNKTDLAKNRAVSAAEAQMYASDEVRPPHCCSIQARRG